jgi:hypothetical protein
MMTSSPIATIEDVVEAVNIMEAIVVVLTGASEAAVGEIRQPSQLMRKEMKLR